MTQNAQQVAHIDNLSTAVASMSAGEDRYIALLDKALSLPDVDMDRIERFATMVEKERNEQARRAFNTAMAAAKAEIQPVASDANNDHTSSKYATLAAIDRAVSPIITKHGFSPLFHPKESAPGFLTVACILSHSDGFEREFSATLPLDDKGAKGNANKTGPHAWGSTATYGRRYLKCMIFDIAVEDDDGQTAARAETLSYEQAKELDALLTETKTDRAAFLKMGSVQRIEDILAENFEAAKSHIQSAHRRQTAQTGGEA